MAGGLAEPVVPGNHRSTRAQELVLLVSCLALFGLWSPPVAADDDEQGCSAKVVVVKIHADWCRTCKALDSVWTQLGETAGDDVTIVELDVSDRVAFNESKVAAEKLGISKFFNEYRSKTGTVAVLQCNSDEPVAVLNGERDLRKYREAIAKASHPS